MTNKHTPGPWKVNAKYLMSVEAVADGQGMNVIAECCDPDGIRTVGEDTANARLIAAAPELLAALEEIIKNAEFGVLKLSKARAAIAKARGQ